MKKINIKIIIISLITGIILGAVTEFVLIFNTKWIINITQSFTFWGIVMFIISIFSEEYVTSIISSSLSMTAMNATYYLIRLIKSGYTNVGNWKRFTIMGIAGSIYIGMIVYCIKKKIVKEKIKDSIPKFSMILMTIFAIILTKIHFYELFHKNRILFGYYLYDPVIIGVYIGAILGTVIGITFNIKKCSELK